MCPGRRRKGGEGGSQQTLDPACFDTTHVARGLQYILPDRFFIEVPLSRYGLPLDEVSSRVVSPSPTLFKARLTMHSPLLMAVLRSLFIHGIAGSIILYY